MGTFLDVEVDDAVEPTAVVTDEEVKLIIRSAEKDVDKNGHDYVLIRVEAPEHSASKSFTHFLGLPHDEMTEKQVNDAKWRIKSFLLAFDMDPASPPAVEDWVGQEGWVTLGVGSDPVYGEQNYIRRLIVPK